MDLQLAIVTDARPTGCTLRRLDTDEDLPARYSGAVQGRIRVLPRQLVAVDTATDPPTVMWRWFRGVVVYRRDDHVVVDHHVYQPGFRAPISVVRLPDILEVAVQIGVVLSAGVAASSACRNTHNLQMMNEVTRGASAPTAVDRRPGSVSAHAAG